MIKIALASDHAGYSLKKNIISHLETSSEYNITDFGTDNSSPVDYPDYAKLLCSSIIKDKIKYGILICATGIGMSIVANRHLSIRAALCTSQFMAEKARQHNNANILVLGSKTTDLDKSILIVDAFFHTDFEGGRHINRLAKIDSIN